MQGGRRLFWQRKKKDREGILRTPQRVYFNFKNRSAGGLVPEGDEEEEEMKKSTYLKFGVHMDKLRNSLKDFYMAHEEKFLNPNRRRSCSPGRRVPFDVISNGLRDALATAGEMLSCT
jgi:hypothetical protein